MRNEARVRQPTKTEKTGKARVVVYEDLENARKERAAKETEKKARKAEKQSEAMSRTRKAKPGSRKDVQREHNEDEENVRV
ncbi:hypothetical protein LTR56_025897 [Elasticomyces elasticus]|nr:hypothetical protein LTR56_025897 [Elasticomyces elasticus]